MRFWGLVWSDRGYRFHTSCPGGRNLPLTLNPHPPTTQPNSIKQLEKCVFRPRAETYIGMTSLKMCAQLHRTAKTQLIPKRKVNKEVYSLIRKFPFQSHSVCWQWLSLGGAWMWVHPLSYAHCDTYTVYIYAHHTWLDLYESSVTWFCHLTTQPQIFPSQHTNPSCLIFVLATKHCMAGVWCWNSLSLLLAISIANSLGLGEVLPSQTESGALASQVLLNDSEAPGGQTCFLLKS